MSAAPMTVYPADHAALRAALDAPLVAEAQRVGREAAVALRPDGGALDDAAASAALASTRDGAGADLLDRTWTLVCLRWGWGQDVYWTGWPYVVDAYYDRCAE